MGCLDPGCFFLAPENVYCKLLVYGHTYNSKEGAFTNKLMILCTISVIPFNVIFVIKASTVFCWSLVCPFCLRKNNVMTYL